MNADNLETTQTDEEISQEISEVPVQSSDEEIISHLEDISLKVQELILLRQEEMETEQVVEVVMPEDDTSSVLFSDISSGINILIGLVIGVSVAMALIKGLDMKDG